ncbi:hypothetical protein [Caldimonas brevitalea]|uniref:Uncharacterized protein n=1 Tax=Caldimonas brevitalea TaxID=413882 RepID=A0A0G3BK02_9BURK|nr:hypothetical protein [Caldimonas brevitalea]AKJ26855.1 hypothetical protein AAW51_0164 [Caldimonas brevitalea]
MTCFIAAVRFQDGHTLFSLFDLDTGRLEPSLITQPVAAMVDTPMSERERELWAQAQLREHGCDPETRIRKLFVLGSGSLFGAIQDMAEGAEEVLVEVPATESRWRSRAHRQKQILLTELNPERLRD